MDSSVNDHVHCHGDSVRLPKIITHDRHGNRFECRDDCLEWHARHRKRNAYDHADVPTYTHVRKSDFHQHTTPMGKHCNHCSKIVRSDVVLDTNCHQPHYHHVHNKHPEILVSEHGHRIPLDSTDSVMDYSTKPLLSRASCHSAVRPVRSDVGCLTCWRNHSNHCEHNGLKPHGNNYSTTYSNSFLPKLVDPPRSFKTAHTRSCSDRFDNVSCLPPDYKPSSRHLLPEIRPHPRSELSISDEPFEGITTNRLDYVDHPSYERRECLKPIDEIGYYEGPVVYTTEYRNQFTPKPDMDAYYYDEFPHSDLNCRGGKYAVTEIEDADRDLRELNPHDYHMSDIDHDLYHHNHHHHSHDHHMSDIDHDLYNHNHHHHPHDHHVSDIEYDLYHHNRHHHPHDHHIGDIEYDLYNHNQCHHATPVHADLTVSDATSKPVMVSVKVNCNNHGYH